MTDVTTSEATDAPKRPTLQSSLGVLAARTLLVAVAVVVAIARLARADIATPLARIYNLGNYDEVIARATVFLNRSGPDPKLLYLRGRAAYRIGWFGMAQADLVPLGTFRPWQSWPPASQLAGQVAAMRALCPPHVAELRSGHTVVFRVYTEVDNAWSKALAKTLPEAYEKVSQFYGTNLAETAVFVFQTGPRYNAFFRAFSGGRALRIGSGPPAPPG